MCVCVRKEEKRGPASSRPRLFRLGPTFEKTPPPPRPVGLSFPPPFLVLFEPCRKRRIPPSEKREREKHRAACLSQVQLPSRCRPRQTCLSVSLEKEKFLSFSPSKQHSRVCVSMCASVFHCVWCVNIKDSLKPRNRFCKIWRC